MSDDEITSAVNTLDPESVNDIASFRALIRQLQALVITLNTLVTELRDNLTQKDAQLKAKDEELELHAAEIVELRKALLGPKSERMPSVDRELIKGEPAESAAVSSR